MCALGCRCRETLVETPACNGIWYGVQWKVNKLKRKIRLNNVNCTTSPGFIRWFLRSPGFCSFYRHGNQFQLVQRSMFACCWRSFRRRSPILLFICMVQTRLQANSSTFMLFLVGFCFWFGFFMVIHCHYCHRFHSLTHATSATCVFADRLIKRFINLFHIHSSLSWLLLMLFVSFFASLHVSY